MCCTFFNPLDFEYRRSLGLNLHHHLRPGLLIIQWVVESANYTMRGAEVHWPVVHSWHQCGTSLWHTHIDVEDLLFAIVVFTHRCGIFVENSCGTKVHKSNIRYILYDTSTIYISTSTTGFSMLGLYCRSLLKYKYFRHMSTGALWNLCFRYVVYNRIYTYPQVFLASGI